MFILGKKVRMTQIWQDGLVQAVTLVQAEPNQVALLRTKKNDGHEAVQLKLGRTKREFRVATDDFKAGETVTIAGFKEGEIIQVSGTVKGRGFQGVVKRHGFGGGPKTHGQKNRFRAPGSIGSTAPQRVWPGRRMAGRMGGNRVTLKNLQILHIDTEKNMLTLKGAIPGNRGTVVEIRSSK